MAGHPAADRHIVIPATIIPLAQLVDTLQDINHRDLVELTYKSMFSQ